MADLEQLSKDVASCRDMIARSDGDNRFMALAFYDGMERLLTAIAVDMTQIRAAVERMARDAN